MAVSGYVRRSFFDRTVHARRNQLAMPVNRLGDVGLVEHIHGNGLPFSESEQGARNGSVVANRLNRFAGTDIERDGGNAERYVCHISAGLARLPWLQLRQGKCGKTQRGQP